PLPCTMHLRLSLHDALPILLNMDVTYGPELRFVPASKRPFHTWLPAGGWTGRLLGALAPRLPERLMQAYIKRLLVTWQHPENSRSEEHTSELQSRENLVCRL